MVSKHLRVVTGSTTPRHFPKTPGGYAHSQGCGTDGRRVTEYIPGPRTTFAFVIMALRARFFVAVPPFDASIRNRVGGAPTPLSPSLPDQWGCSDTQSTDKMQSLKSIQCHDALPIGVSLQARPGFEDAFQAPALPEATLEAQRLTRVLGDAVEGYEPVRTPLTLPMAGQTFGSANECVLSLVEYYHECRRTLGAVLMGRSAQETERLVSFQFALLLFHQWLVANHRFLQQAQSHASVGRCDYVFVVMPTQDATTTSYLEPRGTRPVTLQEVMQANSLSTFIHQVARRLGLSSKSVSRLGQCFGSNMNASLLSRQFHAMDITELYQGLGLNVARYTETNKWRSQVDGLKHVVVKLPSKLARFRMHVLSHLMFTPHELPWSLERCQPRPWSDLDATTTELELWYLLMWYMTATERYPLFQRYLQRLLDQHRHSEHEAAVRKDKCGWLTSMARNMDLCPPHRFQNSMITRMGCAMLYYPPLDGISFLRRTQQLYSVPVTGLDTLLLLSLPMALLASRVGRVLPFESSHHARPIAAFVTLLEQDPHPADFFRTCMELNVQGRQKGSREAWVAHTVRWVSEMYTGYLFCKVEPLRGLMKLMGQDALALMAKLEDPLIISDPESYVNDMVREFSKLGGAYLTQVDEEDGEVHKRQRITPAFLCLARTAEEKGTPRKRRRISHTESVAVPAVLLPDSPNLLRRVLQQLELCFYRSFLTGLPRLPPREVQDAARQWKIRVYERQPLILPISSLSTVVHADELVPTSVWPAKPVNSVQASPLRELSLREACQALARLKQEATARFAGYLRRMYRLARHGRNYKVCLRPGPEAVEPNCPAGVGAYRPRFMEGSWREVSLQVGSTIMSRQLIGYIATQTERAMVNHLAFAGTGLAVNPELMTPTEQRAYLCCMELLGYADSVVYDPLRQSVATLGSLKIEPVFRPRPL